MKKIITAVTICLVLAGCNTKNQNQLMKNEHQSVKNSSIHNVDRKTGQEISKRLVSLATSIPNVNDATAVVLGRYAIVGIDVNSKLDRSQVGSIKYSVAESLKKDPRSQCRCSGRSRYYRTSKRNSGRYQSWQTHSWNHGGTCRCCREINAGGSRGSHHTKPAKCT